ncbi:DNA methyltransferase [Methylobacterium fujisawaense]|uniref:DNA methyltransferase n=1 Tax=Methylobacterium fujisawaense TaxID=107400 RepID=UPI00313BE608
MSERKEQLAENVTLYLGDCREVLPAVGRVDHIITDPPYSDRTHRGHDGAATLLRDGAKRQSLGYGALSADDAQALARVFADAAAGWVVWMTDHTLAPAIQQALAAERRYVFAPLPFFQPGRSVRLTGDGPCSWTDWIICARTAALNKWGTLPGGYVAGEGWADKERMGGKPTRLMSLLVEHYSRRGDVVCDPMMGAGSTGIAAVREGRDFCGIEIDEATFDKACRRISDELRRPRLFAEPIAKPVQQGLFA